jgi:hypothetical protein
MQSIHSVVPSAYCSDLPLQQSFRRCEAVHSMVECSRVAAAATFMRVPAVVEFLMFFKRDSLKNNPRLQNQQSQR